MGKKAAAKPGKIELEHHTNTIIIIRACINDAFSIRIAPAYVYN